MGVGHLAVLEAGRLIPHAAGRRHSTKLCVSRPDTSRDRKYQIVLLVLVLVLQLGVVLSRRARSLYDNTRGPHARVSEACRPRYSIDDAVGLKVQTQSVAYCRHSPLGCSLFL